MKLFSKFVSLNIALVFVLISLGGFVHNTGSSLACPDWPLCFGQVFPKMEGNVAIEHSHRLLATLVGLIHIFLLWLGFKEPSLKKLLLGSFLLLILQGVWGGLTVLLQISPVLSTLHLATSQIYLACLLVLLSRSHPKIQSVVQEITLKAKTVATPKKGLKIVLGVYFLQLIIGAAIRHGGASSACGLGWENSVLCLDPVTDRVSFWPELLASKVHWIHRFLGILLIFLLVLKTVPWIKWGRKAQMKWVRLHCVAIHSCVTLQVVLGVITVATGISLWPVTLHLSVATFLGMLLVGLVFLEHRVYCKGNQQTK